jgi:hypothetical protein
VTARPSRRGGVARAAVLLAALLGAAAKPGAAQLGPLRGYALNVAGVSGSSPLSAGGASDLQRLRLMLAPAIGPVRLEAAYEHVLVYQAHPGAAVGALSAGAAPSPGDWLDLDWTLRQRGDLEWRHRFDRLNASVTAGRLELRVGRQAISWATTLFLSPADPFAPFDPTDPFREYRAGVDAVRAQYFPGPFSQLDVVVRPTVTATGRTLTAAARGRVTVSSWDLSAWAGAVNGDAAAAAGATGAVAGAALRLEVSVRGDPAGRATIRGAAGADRRWGVFGRDLYAVLEYQHDGFGAARPEQLAAVLVSAPFRRGEMQVLGRDVVAGQLRYQVHPLVAVELLVLWDPGDGSALLAPAAAVSASNEMSVRVGLFTSVGDRTVSPAGGIGSEFGPTPRFAYVSASIFF